MSSTKAVRGQDPALLTEGDVQPQPQSKSPPQPSRTSARMRLRLMRAAEDLVAREGLGSLTARKVAKEANSRNVGAIQYHFGTLDTMLDEIVKYRMTELEYIRNEMLAREKIDLAQANVDQLIRPLMLPHVELARREGGRTIYTKFLCSILLWKASTISMRATMLGNNASTLDDITTAIKRRLSHLPTDVVDARFMSSTILFLSTLQRLEPQVVSAADVLEHYAIREALCQVSAVLQASTPYISV